MRYAILPIRDGAGNYSRLMEWPSETQVGRGGAAEAQLFSQPAHPGNSNKVRIGLFLFTWSSVGRTGEGRSYPCRAGSRTQRRSRQRKIGESPGAGRVVGEERRDAGEGGGAGEDAGEGSPV